MFHICRLTGREQLHRRDRGSVERHPVLLSEFSFFSMLFAFGFWLLAFGFWLLAFGFWLLAFGFWLYGGDLSRLTQLLPVLQDLQYTVEGFFTRQGR